VNRRIARILIAALSLGAIAMPLWAQVGYDPRHSPYDDLRQTQEVTVFSGFFHGKKDRAGVAPQSGPMTGVLYQWRAGGPANLSFGVSRVSSERNVLDPEARADCPTAATANCKLIGTLRWPLYFFDGAFALSLTGARSFFHLVPEMRLGVGLASDFHDSPDVGDFAFGTRFAFNGGAGIRWVAGNRFQVRADFINHLYSVRYPDTYFAPAPDGTTILSGQRATSSWLNNPGFTIGMSYLFSR
jgi:hypothetical protein